MQEALGILIFIVVVVGAVAALVGLLSSGKAYGQIGRGGLSLDEDRGPRAMTPAATAQQRDDEIRQMLTARNAWRAARGEATVDVDAELRALTRPAVDAGIEDEVREAVERRNRRRVEKGQEPLDVEAEVQRGLRDLGV